MSYMPSPAQSDPYVQEWVNNDLTSAPESHKSLPVAEHVNLPGHSIAALRTVALKQQKTLKYFKKGKLQIKK